jgi:hypothetical protein
MIWRRGQNLQIGDLVYHVLYGRDWVGLILKMEEELKTPRARVHMVPGTTHEWFFSKKLIGPSEGSRSGWVSRHWLITIKN